MLKISSTEKSYISGFLDGDGCIMYQLISRTDYKYGYQIRASIVFYQKTSNRHQLEWLKEVFRSGYIRDRNDGMTEYTIVGHEKVILILKSLEPYVRLKKTHIEVARKINKLLMDKTIESFIEAARLVDKFAQLNYSKKRKNTSKQLIKYLRQHKLYPRND